MRSTTSLLAICALLGCGGSTESGQDPGSLHIKENTDPVYSTPVVEFVKDLEIGGDEEGPEWQLFTPFYTFTVSPSGSIYVTPGIAKPFHIVAPEGVHLGSFGRGGNGPGEWRYPGPLFWMYGGLELWIVDGGRINRMTPSGGLIEAHLIGKDGDAHVPSIRLSDTRFLGYRRRGTMEQRIHHFGLLDEEFHWVREVTQVLQRPFFHDTDRSAIPVPFTGMPRVLSLEGRGFVVALPDPGELRFYDLEGRPVVRARRDWERVSVTAADREEWLVFMEGQDFYDMSRVRRAPFPEYHPPFTTAVTDENARTWVKRYGYLETDSEFRESVWDVFDSDGLWLGTAILPAVPWIIQGSHLYHRFEGDETRGPRIVRFRIVPLVGGF